METGDGFTCGTFCTGNLADSPRSKFIDVRKKSFTTLSGSTKEKIFPNTPPKIAPTKRDIAII